MLIEDNVTAKCTTLFASNVQKVDLDDIKSP